MKEYKVDQFFREKLTNRKEIPSDNAWEKLSTELSEGKKKKAMVYWYVAASVVFLLGLGYVLISNNPTTIDSPQIAESEEVDLPNEKEPSQTLAFSNEEKPENSEEVKGESNDNEAEMKSDATTESKKKVETKQEPEIKSIEKRIEDRKPEKVIEPAEVINIEDAIAADMSNVGVEEPQTIIPDEMMAEQLAAVNANEEYPEIVITYKKSTTEEKPEKTFKKIVNLARDFTEGGYGIGQLREAKNELLAFERKNSKDN